MTYLACLAAALLAQTPSPSAAAATIAVSPATVLPDCLADLRPLEVRLRKLHLVRPDLLQYPIPYDTIC